MNLNNRELDRILRQKLGQHEVPPPTSAWEHIQKNALDKKSRRFPWLWVGAGIVFISLLAASFFLPFDSKRSAGDPSESIELQEGEPKIPGGAQEDKTTLVPASNDPDISTRSTSSPLTEPTEEQRTATDRSVERSNAQSNMANADRSKSEPKERKISIDRKLPSAEPARETTRSTRSIGNEKDQINLEDTKQKSGLESLDDRAYGILSGLPPATAFEAFEHRILTDDEAAWVDPCQNGLIKEKNCYGFKSNAPVRFALSWYYGPEFPLRSLTTVSTEFSDFADLRNDTETFRYSHGMGIRGSMRWHSGFKLATGLHLSKWQEKFDFLDEDAEIIRTIRVVIDTISVSPDTVLLTDTISVTEYGEKRYRNTNSYTFFDLPLLVGFEVKGRKMDISINTGIFLHLLFQTEGQVLAADGEPVRYNNRDRTDHSIFKTDIGASLYTSVGFFYKLDEHWDFKFEPSIKYMIEPVSLSSYPLEQRYISFNLYMGMRYKF